MLTSNDVALYKVIQKGGISGKGAILVDDPYMVLKTMGYRYSDIDRQKAKSVIRLIDCGLVELKPCMPNHHVWACAKEYGTDVRA